MTGQVGADNSHNPVQAELDAIEDAWARALVSNDAERIAGFIGADWILVSDSGVTSRARFLSLIQNGELAHTAINAVGTSRVRSYGDAAVLTSRVTSVAHYQGQRVDADEWSTDVFIRQEGQWSCVLTHLTAASG
jgi:ketosteroid isomerase-like protein